MARRHRRHGRRHRHNPPRMSARGVVATLTRGAKDAFWVLAGDAGVGAIPRLVGLGTTGVVGTIVELASALGVGMIVHRFGGGEAGRFAVAGGLARVGRSIVIGSGIPVLAPALSAYPGNLAAYPGNLAALPSGPRSTLTLGEMMADEEESLLVQ
jgi:hypothetical protein